MEDESNVLHWESFQRQLMVSSMAWTFYFMFGLALGTPTVAIPQLRAAANSAEVVSDEMASWISSIVGYIGTVWVLVLSTFAHRFGIKTTVLIHLSNSFAAFAVLYFSQSPIGLLVSQVLHGCTAASQTTTTLLILTEYTTPRYRGVFLTIKSATLYWGIWVANSMGLFLPYRYIGLLGILCSIYAFIIILLIPESPYWLARKGRYDECAAAHRWAKGEGSVAEKELKALITSQKTYETCDEPRKTFIQHAKYYGALVTQPEWNRPIALCLLLHVMYFVSGKIVLTVYAIDIIKKITKSQSTAHIGMLILDGITVFGMYAGCGLSKIVKRRRLLISASSLATMFLFLTAAYLFLIRQAIIKENGYVSIALLMAFSLAIACGPMIMLSTIIGELIPLQGRCFSICISALTGNLFIGVFLKLAPSFIKSCGIDGAFLAFAVASTIVIIILYKYLPETKDKTLLEIGEYFKKDKTTELELVSLTKQNNN